MKERMPEYRVLLIGHAHSLEEAWTFARACVDSNLDGVDLNAGDVVTKELVTWLHERGKTVAVWVYRAPAVNDVEVEAPPSCAAVLVVFGEETSRWLRRPCGTP